MKLFDSFMKGIQILLFMLLVIESDCQDYIIDTSFDPQFNFQDPNVVYQRVSYITERSNGNIFVAGYMGNPENGLGSIVQFFDNGQIDNSFQIEQAPIDILHLFNVINDTLHLFGGRFMKIDIYGDYLNYDWFNNSYSDLEASIYRGILLEEDDTIYSVGRFRIPNDNTVYDLIKHLPNGHIDSSLLIDAVPNTSEHLAQIEKYNEESFLISGNFTSWEGYPIINLARVFKNGIIDTTFSSIFQFQCFVEIGHIYNDGRILVNGRISIEGSNETHGLARLYPNGSLDTSFNYCGLDVYTLAEGIYEICPTNNNGFIIGGDFRSYDGMDRGSIAEVDSCGYIIEDVFTEEGFNSIGVSNRGVLRIAATTNNKYYIGGSFDKYNDEVVPRIVRIQKSLNKIDELKNVSVHIGPNPTSGNIVIYSKATIKSMEIISMNGKIEETYKKINSFQYEILIQNKGIYILRINTSDGIWHHKQLVIKNN